MFRRLIVVLFGLAARKAEVNTDEPIHNDGEFEDFCRELGIVRLRVVTCDAPCGCIHLVAEDVAVWNHQWTAEMNC